MLPFKTFQCSHCHCILAEALNDLREWGYGGKMFLLSLSSLLLFRSFLFDHINRYTHLGFCLNQDQELHGPVFSGLLLPDRTLNCNLQEKEITIGICHSRTIRFWEVKARFCHLHFEEEALLVGTPPLNIKTMWNSLSIEMKADRQGVLYNATQQKAALLIKLQELLVAAVITEPQGVSCQGSNKVQ